jgi:hypothetical protein
MTTGLDSALGVLVGAILGSVGTYFANYKIEQVKVHNQDATQRRNLRLVLKLEFEAYQKSMSELKSSLETQGIYSFRWINLIKRNAGSVESLRLSFYALQDDELQERLYALVTDLSLFLGDVETIETWWNGLQQSPPITPNGSQANPSEKTSQENHLKEQRRLKLVDLVDLKRRVDEIAKELGR